MPGESRKKKWHQMTRQEIVATLIAFTVGGSAILAIMIRAVVAAGQWHPFMLIWPGQAMVFVIVFLGLAYFQAIRELRRRRAE